MNKKVQIAQLARLANLLYPAANLSQPNFAHILVEAAVGQRG